MGGSSQQAVSACKTTSIWDRGSSSVSTAASSVCRMTSATSVLRRSRPLPRLRSPVANGTYNRSHHFRCQIFATSWPYASKADERSLALKRAGDNEFQENIARLWFVNVFAKRHGENKLCGASGHAAVRCPHHRVLAAYHALVVQRIALALHLSRAVHVR